MNSTLVKAEVVLAKVYPGYKKFFRYLTVGAVSTTVNLSLFTLLLSYTSLGYLLASILSYHAGMAFSYYLNRTYTFRSAYEKVHLQLASFAAVAYTQLLIVLLVLSLVVELGFRNDDVFYAVIANGIATVIGFIYAFVVNSRLTFKWFK